MRDGDKTKRDMKRGEKNEWRCDEKREPEKQEMRGDKKEMRSGGEERRRG